MNFLDRASDLERAEMLSRYINGTSSVEESAAMRVWITSVSGRADAGDAVGEMWKKSSDEVAIKDLISGWDIIEKRASLKSNAGHDFEKARDTEGLRSSSAEGVVVNAPQWWKRNIRLATYIASAIAVVVVAASSVLFLNSSSSPLAYSSGNIAAYSVSSTLPGQRSSIDLPDGTRVFLNAGTTLEVPRNYSDDNRYVRLIGHAVFEVVASKNSPFIVDAAGTRSTVLGTSFSVRAYDSNVRVAVSSGKVLVAPCTINMGNTVCSNVDSREALVANDIATISPMGTVRIVRSVERELNDFSFMSGRLTLSRRQLVDAIPDINRWFDIDIQLKDAAIGEKLFEGSFPSGTLESFLQSLSVVLNVNVERNGRVIVLSPAVL